MFYRAPVVTPVMAAGFFSLTNETENADIYELIAKGNYGEVYRRLKSGEQASQQHKYGWTPLILAAASNDAQIMKLLLENGADPDCQERYLKPSPTQLSHKIGDAIFSEADERKIKEREKYFPHLAQNADWRGATALFYAVLNNDVNGVKTLLDHGADPLIKTRGGHHPLEMVKEYSDDGRQALPEGQAIKALLIKAIKDRDRMMKEKRKKYPLEARLKESWKLAVLP